MPDPRTARIARNESAFRSLNESLGTNVHGGVTEDHLAGFVCECGDAGCEATVRMPLAAYEEIRQDSCRFFLCPGHEAPDVEDVVEEADGYNVVRKHSDAAPIVDETDPRTESG
ncbi:MAG TPA: hypothetical protein VMY78_05610 [Solirubrobacteraceae bacterium]|nr:hypothetical protein [Solirubrobacteraceae bacterium]